MSRSIGYGQKPIEIETHSFSGLSVPVQNRTNRTLNHLQFRQEQQTIRTQSQNSCAGPAADHGGAEYEQLQLYGKVRTPQTIWRGVP